MKTPKRTFRRFKGCVNVIYALFLFTFSGEQTGK